MGIGEEHFENVTLAGGSETDAAAIVVSTITEDHEPQQLMVICSLISVTIICSFFLQRYRVHVCPPSSAAMLLGILFGVIYRAISQSRGGLRFSPAVFFYGLLPPIVFAAGFNLKKRHFFRNFGSIMLFAVAGTIISTLVFAMSTYLLMAIGLVKRSNLGDNALVVCLLYGSLISAIDPVATLAVFADIKVPSLLYNLVFGESVLNDAVAIVLFNTFEKFYEKGLTWATLPLMTWRFTYIFAGSLVLGIALSLPSAFILKRFQLANMSAGPAFDGGMYEIAVLFLDAYLTYIVSEATGMSGIATLFMAGICHAHYSYYNIDGDSQVTVKKSLEAVAFLAEASLFAYLGLQVSTFDHVIDWGLLLSGIPLCLLSRAANIFPLAYLANLGRELKIPRNIQSMQWAVGLRGAMAYGLVVHLPTLKHGLERQGNPAIETATLFIVCTSTLILGGGTTWLLKVFKLDESTLQTDPAAVELLSPRGAAAPSDVQNRWKEIDRAYLKPYFGGRESNGRDSSGNLLNSMASNAATPTARSTGAEDGNGYHAPSAGMRNEFL